MDVVVIKDFAYADAVHLLAKQEMELQCLIDRLQASSKGYGLQINAYKSGVMVFETWTNRRGHPPPTICALLDRLVNALQLCR